MKKVKCFDRLDIPEDAQKCIRETSERMVEAQTGIIILTKKYRLEEKCLWALIYKAFPDHDVKDFHLKYKSDDNQVQVLMDKKLFDKGDS